MKNLYKGLLTVIGVVGLNSLSWGQCFNPKNEFSAGAYPLSVATGDFNGDGKADIVTANYIDPSTISLLLANNSTGFNTPVSFRVGNQPTSIAVADFNGDGKLDLATSNSSDVTVSVLLNNGNGGFGTDTKFRVGSAPFSVSAGDFNGDGKIDLVVANYADGTVSIILNSGNGSFGLPHTYAVVNNSAVATIAVGDFDGDGKSDIAAANVTINTVSVILNRGNDSFSAPTSFSVGNLPVQLKVGDFNLDGKQDLVTANGYGNTVSVLLGNGTGQFGNATNFAVGSYPGSLLTNDLDGDGQLDIVTVNQSSRTVSALLGNGNGSFGAANNLSVTGDLRQVAAGDFNGDGKSDLVISISTANTVSVLLNCISPAPPVTTGLTLTAPTYDCTTGLLSLSATGGNNTTVEYRIAGLRDYSASPTFTVPAYQRNGTTFTLEARQSGVVSSRLFATTCQSTTPAPPTTPTTPTPTPPTTTGLSMAQPTYDCTSGQLALSTTGGNGSLVEYRVAGLRDWATGNIFTVPSYQRTGTAFTPEARQSGVVISLPFTSACQTSTTPTTPITPTTPPSTGQVLTVSATPLNCQTGALQLVTAGGDGTAVDYKVPGLRDYSPSSTFTIPTYQRSNTSFTFYARQSGREVTGTYTAACPAGSRIASPETDGRLSVVVYPNPVGERFTVGVSGAAGQSVGFRLTNLQGQSVVEHRTQVMSDTHTETLSLPITGAGLYLLQVSTPTQSQTVKVLRQ